MVTNALMTPGAIDREMERLNGIVRAAGDRFHRNSARTPSGEAVDWSDPFEELAQREEVAIREATIESLSDAQKLLDLVDLPQPLVDRIRARVLEEFVQYENTLIEWLFAAGPHPLEVVRRLFAYVKMKRASLLWNMGFRSMGKLLKESYESMRLRCEMLFGSTPAGWKKDAAACERMKAAAMGNNCRKGGRKMRPPNFAKPPTQKQPRP